MGGEKGPSAGVWGGLIEGCAGSGSRVPYLAHFYKYGYATVE